MQASRQTRRQTKRHPQDLPAHTHSHFQLKLHPTSAETYGHIYIHIHSNSYIIDVYTFIYAYTYLKLNPSLVSHSRVSHAMAPVAVVDKSSKPSLALSQGGGVEMILKRAGIEENHPDALQGRGRNPDGCISC